jgi:hypothetical protein
MQGDLDSPTGACKLGKGLTIALSQPLCDVSDKIPGNVAL